MKKPIIKTHNLTKIYQLDSVQVPALKNVDLEIKEGEFVSIMGPSGSGKSTLLNLIGCLDTPTTGKYVLDGTEISKDISLAHIRRDKIGFIFQTFNLLPRLSAIKNVEVPMIYKGVGPQERQKIAKKLLKSVGLEERMDHQPNQLSGGERQRVAIARALANNPSVILADEPTGNLDTKTGEEIKKILKDLHNKGTTIVMVTHDEYMAEMGDRIIRLLDGEVVESNQKSKIKMQNEKVKFKKN